MGTDPAAVVARDDLEAWLSRIASGGMLRASDDNMLMARAALLFMETRRQHPPADDLPEGNLTEHFTLAEFTASDTAAMNGIDNTPSDLEIDELEQTAQLLEKIRSLCGGAPVIVSSGYRCPELNAAVGGAGNSAHLYGCAADITVPKFGTALQLARAIEPHVAEWGIDQLIYEMTWVHLGRAIPPGAPRAQCLTINSGGTYSGIVA